MSKVFSKFTLAFIRIMAISFVLSFILMELVEIITPVPEKTLTILSYSPYNENFDKHLTGSIPIKVIATDSRTDIEADIVYFPTDVVYEEYKDSFNILETVRISNIAYLYIKEGLYDDSSIEFNDVIDAIRNNKEWSDFGGSFNSHPVELKIDMHSKESPAFLALLFNYFSEGKPYDRLTTEEQNSIIQSMRDFIEENQPEDVEKAAIFSSYYSKDGYYRKSLNMSAIVSERLVAVTDYGKEYINDVKEKYFEEKGISGKLISYLPPNVVKSFQNVEFDYEMNSDSSTIEENLFGVWMLITIFGGAIIFAVTLIFMCEYGELYLTPVFSYLIFLVVPLSKTYLATIIIACVWLLLDMLVNEFYDFSRELEKLQNSKEQRALEKKQEKEVAQKEKLAREKEKARQIDFVEQYGEDKVKLYEEFLSDVNRMAKFNEEVGIDDDVWIKIRDFVQHDPSCVSIMHLIIGKEVSVMLDVYEAFPKDANGKLRGDFEELDEVKRTLSDVNQIVLEDFNDKKAAYYRDIKACLKLVNSFIKARM